MDSKPLNKNLEQAEAITQDDIDMYRTFNSTASARRSLEHLKVLFFDTRFYNDNEQQPYASFYHGGQRDVVGYILECIGRVRKQSQTEMKGAETDD